MKNDKSKNVIKTFEKLTDVGYFECELNSGNNWISKRVFSFYGVKDETFHFNPLLYKKLVVREDKSKLFNSLDELFKMSDYYENKIKIKREDDNVVRILEIRAMLEESKDDRIILKGTIQDVTKMYLLQQEIETILQTDSLTGVYNRNYFREYINVVDKPKYYPISIIMADVNGLKDINDTKGYDAGDKALIKLSKQLQVCLRKEEQLFRIGSDEFAIVITNDTIERAREIIIEFTQEQELAKNNHEDDILSLSFGYASKEDKGINLNDVIKDAEDFMYHSKSLVSSTTKSSAIDAMMNTLFEVDEISESHSKKVSRLSGLLAEYLDFSDEKVIEIRTAGLLHDIGKVRVPKVLLTKKTGLTMEEYQEIKKHAESGYRILQGLPKFKNISKIVLHHHERYDGKGYPEKLKGEDIPIESRIISVVDAFVLMTINKSYGVQLSVEDALGELSRNSGTQFDPVIVDNFIKMIVKQRS